MGNEDHVTLNRHWRNDIRGEDESNQNDAARSECKNEELEECERGSRKGKGIQSMVGGHSCLGVSGCKGRFDLAALLMHLSVSQKATMYPSHCDTV